MEGFKTSHLQPSQRLVLHRPPPGSNTTLASHGAVRSVCFGCARCAVRWRSSIWILEGQLSPADSWRWRSSILPLDPQKIVWASDVLPPATRPIQAAVVAPGGSRHLARGIEQVGSQAPKTQTFHDSMGTGMSAQIVHPPNHPWQESDGIPKRQCSRPFSSFFSETQ